MSQKVSKRQERREKDAAPAATPTFDHDWIDHARRRTRGPCRSGRSCDPWAKLSSNSCGAAGADGLSLVIQRHRDHRCIR